MNPDINNYRKKIKNIIHFAGNKINTRWLF
jgi:hypothetical protein